MNRLIKQNNNISFGKEALMTCNIMSLNNNASNPATLYKLDPNNITDKKDVYYSKNTQSIASDFEKSQYESFPRKDFYIVRNDKTGEVLSCAEVSTHYASSNTQYPGQYTLIEELKGNNKFSNAQMPLLAYITKNAQNKSDEYVVTAFDDESAPYLNNNMFTQAKTGEFIISKDKFPKFSHDIESTYNIEYIV